jgi:hypothetical protein
MKERLHLQIRDYQGIQRASEILHDARFLPADARYDPAAEVFSLELTREVEPTVAATRFSWIDRVVREPEKKWARCSLTFRRVKRVEIDSGEQFECLLEGLSYDAAARVIRFEIMGPVAIRVHVSQLDGELRELEDAG